MCVYLARTEDRRGFVRSLLSHPATMKRVQKAGRILLKPNIVSSEPYPTTTHPDTLRSCLEILISWGKEVAVADGPAIDAGCSRDILSHHPLKEVCDSFGVALIDLLSAETVSLETESGHSLEVARLAFDYDLIISLPVLKSHGICFFTGALKNQFGFFSAHERARLHSGKDIFRAIAEINALLPPGLFIVDAVETLIRTNEVRHGGVPARLGYMLGGGDPLGLDMLGLRLLGQVDPGLRNKCPQDIPYLAYAAGLPPTSRHSGSGG